MCYQVKVTPPALRNASAAQMHLDVLSLGILQLGKYYLNSSQREMRRAGQGPEALKEQRVGWITAGQAAKGHKGTANLHYLSNSRGGQRAGRTNLHSKPSSQTHSAEL